MDWISCRRKPTLFVPLPPFHFLLSSPVNSAHLAACAADSTTQERSAGARGVQAKREVQHVLNERQLHQGFSRPALHTMTKRCELIWESGLVVLATACPLQWGPSGSGACPNRLGGVRLQGSSNARFLLRQCCARKRRSTLGIDYVFELYCSRDTA